jgi:hypothetical protein
MPTPMTEPTDNPENAPRGGLPSVGSEGEQDRGPSAKGWGQRPATGRSFLIMMILAVLATACATFWGLRSISQQKTAESERVLSPDAR